MPNVQTQVTREQLAELHKRAILSNKTLKDYINQVITKHLKEDLSWQTKQLKPQNAPEN